MPVKTDKLLQLLCLMFLSYWLLKTFFISVSVISQEMEKDGKLFKPVIVDANNVKYVSSLSYLKFLNGIQNDEQVLKEFIDILRESSFSAYFFETPKVTHETLGSTNFEFVLAKAERLESVEAEEETFRDHFGSCEENELVTNFENLGRDAMLVVPCPSNENKQIYSSIAPFMRAASADQIEQFWKTSARTLKEHLKKKGEKNPTWMSTSGLGVYWLHLRLDSRPKYYTFNPYRR